MAIDGLFSGDVTLIVPGYPGFASLIIPSPLLLFRQPPSKARFIFLKFTVNQTGLRQPDAHSPPFRCARLRCREEDPLCFLTPHIFTRSNHSEKGERSCASLRNCTASSPAAVYSGVFSLVAAAKIASATSSACVTGA